MNTLIFSNNDPTTKPSTIPHIADMSDLDRDDIAETPQEQSYLSPEVKPYKTETELKNIDQLRQLKVTLQTCKKDTTRSTDKYSLKSDKLN